MPLLTDIRDAACALLTTACPSAARVEGFAGPIDMDGIARRNVQYADKGLLFVAIGDAANAAAPGSLDFDMAGSFAVLAIARNAARPTKNEDTALVLAQTAARALHGATFGLAGVSPARVTTLEPLEHDDEKLAASGIRVWMLTWEQRFVFGEEA